MKNYLGWWFPDNEEHFPMMLNKSVSKIGIAEYQSIARNKSLEYVKSFRIAIDIGANVGLWTRPLSQHFQEVYAFEPVPIFLECLKKNILPNTKIFEVALGNEFNTVDMVITKENMGMTYVDYKSKGKGSTILTTLDSYNFNEVDYIKVDCEGFELPVLIGAKNTILSNKPIIVVEQKPHPHFTDHWKQTEALNYLSTLGMRPLDRVNDDHIMGF